MIRAMLGLRLDRKRYLIAMDTEFRSADLARAEDRFPLGLPGHRVPLTKSTPTELRPWGMDLAVPPASSEWAEAKHKKPTATKKQKVPTEHTNDGKKVPDEYTQTVTD